MSLEKLTRDLISIDSVTGDEDKIIAYIEGYLKEEGYSNNIELHDGGLVVGNSTERSVIALVGHVDTVPISGEQENINNTEIIYGRGAVDMKSGLAVMIRTIINSQDKNIIGIFYKGEEGLKEHNGLETLFPKINQKFNISLGIIFEPTNNEAQLGCQGVLNAELSIRGLEAHSARPWLGDNAVYKSIPLLEDLKNLKPDPIYVDELEYKEVVTLTTIIGGTAKNVIPGEVICGINYRFSPDKTTEDAVKNLTNLLSGYGDLLIHDFAESAHPNRKDEIVQKFINITGVKVEPKQAWTDVARFTSAGIPALNFGPGNPDLAHKANEHLAIEDINECFSLVEQFLKEEA